MKRRVTATGLTLVLLAAACSSGADEAGTRDATVTVTEDRASGGIGGDDGGSGDRSSGHPTTDHLAEGGARLSGPGAADAEEAAAVGDVREGDDAAPQQSTELTAGWVDDNDDFADYLDYLDRSTISGVSLVDVSARQVIRVVDAAGLPVVGAVVELRVGDETVHRATTHADGRVLAFPAGDPDVEAVQQRRQTYSVVVRYEGQTVETELDSSADDHEVTLDGARRPVTALDVLFLIDATGSMSDEIDRLKTNMSLVADQIAAEQAQLDLRFAMVTYRDHGDDYLTRTTDFTDDLATFQSELDAVSADGGGDNPEAVDEALQEAVDGVSWRTGDAIGLVFLVADAPPHLDDPQNAADYADSALDANVRGIKVFPVASSGLDPVGEYVFRQVAQLTGAPFVFLTYGADGGPGSERPEFDVDDYSVLALDQLIVRLVTEEIRHQI